MPSPLPTVASREPVEPFAPSELQTTCDPTEKVGVAAWRDFLLGLRGGTNLGIVRACDKGGASEHKEGRAFDWGMNAQNPADATNVTEVLAWVLAPDAAGADAALFRRLGLMYVIWNKNVWSTRTKRWMPYTGANPHTDHVHFSFGWPGALAQTSFFRWLGVRPSPSPVSSQATRDTTVHGLIIGAVGIVLGYAAWSSLTKRFAVR